MLVTRRDKFFFIGLIIFGLLMFVLEAADHVWFLAGLGLGIAVTGAVLRFGVQQNVTRLQFASYVALAGFVLMFISLFTGLLGLFILSSVMLVAALLAALWRPHRRDHPSHASS